MPAKKRQKQATTRAKAVRSERGSARSKRGQLVKRGPASDPGGLVLPFPSGRSVTFRAEGSVESIEVRSAGGQMELRIALTDKGPVVSLNGARLEINSTDALAVNCRDFEVNATGAVRLNSSGDVAIAADGEMRVKTLRQTHIDAELVNLNCGDRSDYPDEETAKVTQAAVDRVLAERAASQPKLPVVGSDACGCDHT